MVELQNLGITDTRLYSSLNSFNTKRIYMGEGVDAAALLALSGYTADMGGNLIFLASDNYAANFNSSVPLNAGRNYYPNFGVADGEDAGAEPVSALLAWKTGSIDAPMGSALPNMVAESPLRLLVGQAGLADPNNVLFNLRLAAIRAGDAITEQPIDVLGSAYTRAELLMKPRAERIYTYPSSDGERNDRVRGVPFAALLDGLSDSAVIEFCAADGYDMSAYDMTKGDLVAQNAILAYEVRDTDDQRWEGIYSTAKPSAPNPSGVGYFTLYVDGMAPGKMIDAIREAPIVRSQYKHIDYSGAPYNLDAITGATLTVEGPGVRASTPITVRELEETANANIYQGVYSDYALGTRTYEGVTLISILDGAVNTNVRLLDESVVVVFKNRWRQEVGRLAYGQIKGAAAPVMLAYGIADANGDNASPFVFTGGAGEITALGNGDGPLKLVFDRSEFLGFAANDRSYQSVAYLYIEEGVPPPGFKHMQATDEAYSNKTNTEYLVTFTGDALGREVSFTVAELEAMVAYEGGRPAADGLGYREEYGLSNTTYWYVNEYEGVKVWDLLTSIGVDPSTYADDDSTLVSFSSWDNYVTNAVFSMRQLANPDLFYFYEKSPLDIGTDRPTKEQLADPAYQPDNQGLGWTLDENGYPVKKGYPVMLAYGINGYPYVRDSRLPGFKSGLGNDGGPLRVIYGKTDGLNRSDLGAVDNYAYFFNNGSNQMQRVQEVYVGDPVRYSAHAQNPDPAYQAMKDSHALTVEVVVEGKTSTYDFTLEELENILYGTGVSKRDRDNEKRQEKGYYYYKNAGTGDKIEDLFEGVSLEYLLTEHIGLQGSLGSVSLYSGSNAAPSAVFDLTAVGERGHNSLRGTSGLGMAVAFAKNGYPLVSGSGATPGYVSEDSKTGKTIKNNGGPLQFLRGQTANEYAGGAIITGSAPEDNKTSVENLTRIVVNLDPDVFAHTGTFEAYAEETVLFSGAVTFQDGVSMTVGRLETLQKYMVTGAYEVGGASSVYRGLDLFGLLNDKAIGASARMDGIIVKNAAGESTMLTVAELNAAGKSPILAYGIAKAGDPADGKPLVPAGDSAGYDAGYGNTGGPLRLIIDGGTAGECVVSVNEIEVSAAEVTVWKHDFGVFADYADETLAISGQNLVHNHTYTVAELEAMDHIMVFDSYAVGGEVWVQGVSLYQLLQNIGFAGAMDTSVFTAYASDNYSVQFDGKQLKEGVNGKPVLVAYGQGTNSTNGLPLVRETTSPGFDSNVNNAFGPLRLVVHDNSGWSVKYLARIVVGASGGVTDPEPDEPDFYTFESYPTNQKGLPNAGVRNLSPDNTGGLWVGTYGGGMAYLPKGADGFTVYSTQSEPALYTDFASAVAADDAGGVWFSQNASYTEPGNNRGVGYMKDGAVTWYRAGDSPATIPDDYIQAIEIDKDGNVWFGSFGGLTRYDVHAGTWTTWTRDDGLPAASVNTIAFDGTGGLWIGCYPDTIGSMTAPGLGEADTYRGGYAHLNATGEIDFAQTYEDTAENDLTAYLLADFWVRGIAVDGQGGAWVVRSGSYPGMPNVGGRVDYVDKDRKVVSYTGLEMLGESLTVDPAVTPELRMVAVDKNGGLWFSTSGDGLFHCTAPGQVYRVYNTASYAWPSGTPMDNIYALLFNGDTLYVGSNGGVAWAEIGLAHSIADYVGDATVDTALLRITGAVDKPGYFSINGLQAYTSLVQTKTYNHLNNSGTKNAETVTGIYLEDLLTKIMTLSPEADSVTLTASDNFSATYKLSDEPLGIHWTDIDGNKIMLSFNGSILRLAVGQIDSAHINRALWLNGIASISVNSAGEGKRTQIPPFSLTGEKPTRAEGLGRIRGTTTAMEYGVDGFNWLICNEGYTEVAPRSYYVRFAETDTRYASLVAEVTVPEYDAPPPPPPPDNGILAVYNSGVKAHDFTQSEIDELPKMTMNYSTFSTFPTYHTYTNVSGVNVMTLLAEAGLFPNDSQEITFFSKDDYSTTLKIGDLTAKRYYFNENRTRGSEVPPIISFEENGGHLYFGSLTSHEQTNFAFAHSIDRIALDGVAGTWGVPSANPPSGRAVDVGDEIRLALPAGSGNAKLYYTLDGSMPTMQNDMYNVSAYVENPPIIVPEGLAAGDTFTVTARIIGLGRFDGDVVTFTYSITAGALGDEELLISGGGPGAATVIIEANAVPLGDMPVVSFGAEELSKKIQEVIAIGGEKILELRIIAVSTASSVEAQIPAKSIKEMIDAGLRYLVISNLIGSNSYDLAALKSIYGQGDGDRFDFIIRKVDPKSLEEALQTVVSGNDLYEVLVLCGGKEITGFDSGQAITRIFYALKPSQSAYGLKVWHMGADGSLTEIGSTYNSVQRYLQFVRSSHSWYMVGYDAAAALWTANPFLDVKEGDWFYDVVRFVCDLGLMAGTTPDLFSPNTTLTRAMAVTVLHRLAGSPEINVPVTASGGLFADVAEEAYYYQAVNWAAANGVVNGYGDGRFGSEDVITREQLAAIMANYESFAAKIPLDTVSEKTFADADAISDWAKNPVDTLTRQGIIGGKPGNLFDPKGGATRAEFAAIMQRFIGATN
ncbi:MAG: S-layer homology domain-containing protein [Peptococcaceae bacterium]|nr:S-layer homology domain-containing protein [Peptococcaceae bacterium]